MKINKKPAITTISHLEPGSAFMEYDSYYIKTNYCKTDVETEDEMLMCVDIETGRAEWFYPSDSVYPVEVECILKENEEVDG